MQLPIAEFLKQRLEEYDPSFDLRKGTGYETMFFKPIEFIVQPLRDEANEIFTSQSLLRIILTGDPDSYNETAVDSIVANIYVLRRTGSKSSGQARVYYNEPFSREFPEVGAVFTGSNSKTYSNNAPLNIKESEMSLNVEDGLYYFDISVESDENGVDTELEKDELVSLAGDADYVKVTNKNPIKGGLDRETNTELINRGRNSIGVRDLVTGKGFRAILFETFLNSLLEVQPIGFSDNEMMRDIVHNVHVGGRVDGYVKTSRITQGYSDFFGLLVDTTRQFFSSKNIVMSGTAWQDMGAINIDRSNDKDPIIKEVKIDINAQYLSTVDMTSAIDLSVNQHIRIGIDGSFKEFRLAGLNPGATSRNEILAKINAAFGVNVAFTEGNSIIVKSPTHGPDSIIVIDNPTVGNSCINEVFGLTPGSAPYSFYGDGAATFTEGVHYEIDDSQGIIKRVIGPTVVNDQNNGESISGSDIFSDGTANIFINVQPLDIVTIISGGDLGDYRVISKINNNSIKLDSDLIEDDSNVEYRITRTGIKDGELVYAQYYFNPLSIDVGKYISLDEFGREKGIRPGRENFTITDLPILRISKIEVIDPLTFEPTGEILDGDGGYGQGGFGQGSFGVGSGSEWRLIVNTPEHRFSMLEDSYIVIHPNYQAMSLRVHYDYVPEIESYHDFVRSDNERTLDGDTLMKHLLPAYISGSITYKVDETDLSIPSNIELVSMVRNFIEKIPHGEDLEYSDISQFILNTVDPNNRYNGYVDPFKLEGSVYNTDGSVEMLQGDARLEIIELDPFPRYTKKPLTKRISKWIPGEITLNRVGE